ncbi:cyclase [Arthrobacter sp. ZBG10]|uniref:SRPBCC family protein n=1 Tax=Micrococcaceae TaxID=1268 RepID=UPI000680C29A|nr:MULTISPECIES: SRPBCC family protein [Micrococcaceae]KNH18288.1 cyclase [Arthrobacter sp. ZBG10]
MSTKVEKRILVNVPVSTAYNQWTQFEEFPHFMGGVKSVRQLSDDRLEWVAEIGGIRRQWEARILEQVVDRRVAWAATEGATNAGAVEFEDVGGGQTSLQLTLEYEPEGLIEKVGDKLNVVDRQAEADLQRFKEFIEDEGYASGAWRGTVDQGGTVGTPGVEDAAGSRGDSGKAGISGAVAAGLGVAAAAGAVAAVGAATSKQDDTTRGTVPPVTVEPVPAAGAGSPAATPVVDVPVESTTPGTGSAGSVADLGDDRIGHTFDQTNGLVDTSGESDGTAEGDLASKGEREDGGLPAVPLPPINNNLRQP